MLSRDAGHTPALHNLVLAVAGGDGTINEAVNGLIAAAGTAQAAPLPLAIVPLGTANVLAREIGQAISSGAAAETALRGQARQVYLGQANGRCFTIMAGVVFDAHVVANVSLGLKRRIGKLAYVWEALRQLFLFPYARYRVTVDGDTSPSDMALLMANGAAGNEPLTLDSPAEQIHPVTGLLHRATAAALGP